MFVNKMPRYEILSEDAMAALDRGWRRIVSELGIEFVLPEALDLGRSVASARAASVDGPSFSSRRASSAAARSIDCVPGEAALLMRVPHTRTGTVVPSRI